MSKIEGVKTFFVIALMIGSVFTDLRSRKIPNRMLFGTLLFFLALQFAFSGWVGLWPMLGSVAAAFFCTLPLYLMKAIAAGDAKLLLVSSILLPWQIVASTCLYSLIWGALLGVCKVLLSGQGKVFVLNIKGLVTGQKPDPQTVTAIPYSIAIFFAFLSSLTLSFWGVQWI